MGAGVVQTILWSRQSGKGAWRAKGCGAPRTRWVTETGSDENREAERRGGDVQTRSNAVKRSSNFKILAVALKGQSVMPFDGPPGTRIEARVQANSDPIPESQT